MSIPVCEHGETKAHDYYINIASVVDCTRRCPGPMPVAASAEPTTDDALARDFETWWKPNGHLSARDREIARIAWHAALRAQAAAPLTDEMIEAEAREVMPGSEYAELFVIGATWARDKCANEVIRLQKLLDLVYAYDSNLIDALGRNS